MIGLLARLRRSARGLAAIAVLALLLPAAAAGPRAPALPELVVCTAEGLVSIPLGDAPADAGGGHCAACLRVDLADLPPPPAALPLPPAAIRLADAAPPAVTAVAHHARTPQARAPPALA